MSVRPMASILSSALFLSLNGQAVPIVAAASGLVSATHHLSFEELDLADDTLVTNQFLAQGVTFDEVSNGVDEGMYFNTFGPGFYDGIANGFGANYIGNFSSQDSTRAGTISFITMNFSYRVAELTVALNSGAETVTMDAYRNGNLVDTSGLINLADVGFNGYWGFHQGLVFDQIVFSMQNLEADTGSLFDDISFNVGPTLEAPEAPELDLQLGLLPLVFASITLALLKSRRSTPPVAPAAWPQAQKKPPPRGDGFS